MRMESRLAQVLRAGEAHRQPMENMDDDALRLITDAIGNGDVEAACHAARKWCALNKRHRIMCKEGGDELWHALTRRLFGEDKIGAHREDSQANFFELCRIAISRTAARRWLRARHPGWTMTGELQSDAFLDRLGAILEVIDNNYLGQPMQNMTMVYMLKDLFLHKPDGFPNTDLLALYSMDSLYAMVRGKVDAEIDAALELLHLLANDYDAFHEDHYVDNRKGYAPGKVGLLRRLLQTATVDQADRTENILGIWSGLLSNEVEMYDEETVDDQGRYARAMLRHNVDGVLASIAADSSNRNIRRTSANVLTSISRALNASLTMAMQDASGPHASVGRMGLVYGRD